MAKITIDDTLDFTPDTLSVDGKTYILWVPVAVDKGLVDAGIVDVVAQTYDQSWNPIIPDPAIYTGPKPPISMVTPENRVKNPKTAAQAVAETWYKELAKRTATIAQQAHAQALLAANPLPIPPSIAPFLQ